MVLLAYVIAIILNISSTAHADSWVLWEKKQYTEISLKQTTTWEIFDAYPEHKQCLQGMKKLWQVEKKLAKERANIISKIEDVPYNSIFITYKQSNEPNAIIGSSEYLFCLPGTLDPREKK